MQLFITDYTIQDHQIILSEERVVYQMKRVLRAKPGYIFMVQKAVEEGVERISCELIDIVDEKIYAQIKEKNIFSLSMSNNILAVAIPNKFEKIELIVQKCCEIGLSHIIFFQSQHSQLKEVSENKKQRLEKIALEAVEQSYGYALPRIDVMQNIAGIKKDGYTCFVLHQDGNSIKNYEHDKNFLEKKSIMFFVGPEGGRGDVDEKYFSESNMKKISLGKNILRTETASIISAWELMK